MKHLMMLLLAGFVLGWVSFALEGNASNPRVQAGDKAIREGKISVDTLLDTMVGIHEYQKATIVTALAEGKQKKIDQTLAQWSELHPLTSHLYDLKAGSGVRLMNASGEIYTFKTQSPLKWLNLSRWDEEYYRFPLRETFLEVDFVYPQTWTLRQETSLTLGTGERYPSYFYDGGVFLSELSYKDTGMSIVDLAHSDQERYFFFDLAEEDLQNFNAQLALLNGEHTPLMNVFQTVSYTPGYFMTSLNPGFQYCQEVARFVWTSSQHKEYAAVDCSLAAKGQFSKEMHPDILAYAQHLAQQ